MLAIHVEYDGTKTQGSKLLSDWAVVGREESVVFWSMMVTEKSSRVSLLSVPPVRSQRTPGQ